MVLTFSDVRLQLESFIAIWQLTFLLMFLPWINKVCHSCHSFIQLREASRIAQWWERSLPSNMGRIDSSPVPCVGWVCSSFSPCSEGFFTLWKSSSLNSTWHHIIDWRLTTKGWFTLATEATKAEAESEKRKLFLSFRLRLLDLHWIVTLLALLISTPLPIPSLVWTSPNTAQPYHGVRFPVTQKNNPWPFWGLLSPGTSLTKSSFNYTFVED